jgi:hypothetical protein
VNTQEMFDQAVLGVVGQGKRSVNAAGKCLYRGPNGLKCAVGFLIADKRYNAEYNGAGASSPEVINMIEASIGRELKNIEISVLESLQTMHDGCERPGHFIDDFIRGVTCVAKDYNLKMPVVLP